MSDSAQLPLEIPDKVFFRIGEVARLTGVKAYVLRYWETEFAGLKPQKSASGQRRYRRSDVEFVLRLKSLLWDQGFTIKGARSHLLRRSTRPEELAGPSSPGPTELEPSDAGPDPETQRLLVTQTNDLNTVRRSLTQMRVEIANFLDELDR